MSFRPEIVNILGKPHTIIYCDKPSDVNIHGRTSLWGEIDYWTRTIRLYSKTGDADILHNLFHEILHGITVELHIETITKASDAENVIDLLSLALADIISRNDWIEVKHV